MTTEKKNDGKKESTGEMSTVYTHSSVKMFQISIFPQFYIVKVNIPSIKKILCSVKITKKVRLFRTKL